MKNLLNVLLMTLLIGIVFSCQKDAPAPVEAPDPGLKSTPTTHYVNPGESIQEAVDAASHGDIIMIAPGIYEELVFIIEKDLTLIGEDGATILSPNITDPVPFWDLILVYGCDANFENLIFDGGNHGGGLNDLLYFVEAGGEVTGCTFQNVNGWGIYGDHWDETVRTIVVKDNLINGYTRCGMFLGSNRPGSSYPYDYPNLILNIKDNTWANTPPAEWVPWVVHIGFGGGGISAHIKSNDMQGTLTPEIPDLTAINSGHSNYNVMIHHNTITESYYGIVVFNSLQTHILHNEVHGGDMGVHGISGYSDSGFQVMNNTVDAFTDCLFFCDVEDYKVKNNNFSCDNDWSWCIPLESVSRSQPDEMLLKGQREHYKFNPRERRFATE